jgi:hypothetical protein
LAAAATAAERRAALAKPGPPIQAAVVAAVAEAPASVVPALMAD